MSENKFYEDIKNWNFSNIDCIIENTSSWNFYDEIRKYVNKNSLLLDLGTGGGEKVLKNMPDVGMVIATDYSKNMIETANNNLLKYKNKNIKFVVMDNFNMKFPNNLFDLISARHTPIDYNQVYSVLKDNGIIVIKGIENDDCIELKKVFKRGQGYNNKILMIEKEYNGLKNVGFKDIETQRIIKYEYYKDKKELLKLLLKTPILNDFENIKIENDLLDEYIQDNTTDKGIKLERVQYSIVAKK